MIDPALEQTSATFGPYEVFERLGMGGMAMVHRAKKRGIEGFERSVALKRMLQHLAEDSNFVDSFIREAKVASMLHHPNIAQVHDFGRIGGVYYIAMELVTGFDVRKLLRYASKIGEPIPMPVILSILGELADALEYAHNFHDETGQPLKIVHRDISPSNLIVAHTGHLKVIDFGIAKANSRQLQTESGQVKGKLGYMSPEAAHGMTLDPVSDIFSMGVVAWELVTASPLFSARTDYETMRRIREADITPPSYHNANCPAELDSIIIAALDREPSRRLPSAAVFRAAIDALATQHGIHSSARSVAEWIMRFAQPGDMWARSSHAAQSRQQMPVEQPTSLQRPKSQSSSGGMRPSARLQRSPEQAKLAIEIWGDDAQGSPVAAADFSMQSPSIPSLRPPTQPPPVLPEVSAIRSMPIIAPPSEPRMSPPVMTPTTGPVYISSGHYSQQSGQLVAPPLTHQPYAAAKPARPNRTPIVILAGLFIVAGVLGGVLLLKRAKQSPAEPTVEIATKGQLRLNVEPADAVIEIAGKPVGGESPFSKELEPGVYTVSVRKDGYKSWSADVNVHAGDPQVLNIALVRGIAHVTIDSDPRGLPIDIDGKPSGSKTPARIDVPSGEHELKVTSATGEVWTEKVNAAVDGSHTYTAMLAKAAVPPKQPDKQPDKPDKGRKPNIATIDRKPPKQPDVVETPKQPDDVEPPKQPPTAPVKQPDDVEPPKQPGPTPPPKQPDKPARTPVVAASAVTKVSGEVPTLKGKSGDANGDVLAKMCIDETGKVTSVKIVKSSADIANDLARALTGWRYKPYLNKDKQPSPVCFPLSLRVVFKGG